MSNNPIKVSVPKEPMPLFYMNMDRLGNAQPAKLIKQTLQSAQEEIQEAMNDLWYSDSEDYEGDPVAEFTRKDCDQVSDRADRAVKLLQEIIQALSIYRFSCPNPHALSTQVAANSEP
ncbi:MAG: hypothetical protein LBV12_07170, partial [Puniceicoccales bacterium]|nr:hypothetical protein [Puniceicoccales bacterium]